MVADADERDDILPFVTPRCALQVERPSFFLASDALQLAAVDQLTSCITTGKVWRGEGGGGRGDR